MVVIAKICDACEPGHFLTTSATCETCGSRKQWQAVVLSGGLIVVFAAAVAAARSQRAAALWEFVWSSMASQVKILWSTLQIIAHMSVYFSHSMPPVLLEFYNLLEFSNLNPLQILALSCTNATFGQFFPKLLFTTLTPLGLGIAILIRFELKIRVWKHDRALCVKHAQRLLLLLCYLVLPACSSAAFRTFLCDSDFGDSTQSWLVADYAVSCFSAKYLHVYRPFGTCACGAINYAIIHCILTPPFCCTRPRSVLLHTYLPDWRACDVHVPASAAPRGDSSRPQTRPFI